MADDGGGKDFQGETAGKVALPGVREGTGKGVAGGAPPNPARRDKQGVGVGGRREIRGQQSKYLQDYVLREIRNKALLSRMI